MCIRDSLYDTVFGGKGNANRDAGAGAAVGVILALIIVVVYFVMKMCIRDRPWATIIMKWEYILPC